jgi:hypothetical protein
MSHATFHDLVHHYDADTPTTACAAVRYALDDATARRFKLRRSNADAYRAATGTKRRPAPSK